MLQFDDFSKDEFELPRTRVLPDLRDHYSDLRRARLHSVNQTEQEGHLDLREAFYPVWFDFSVLDALRSVGDFLQPLTLDRRSDFVHLRPAPCFQWYEFGSGAYAVFNTCVG